LVSGTLTTDAASNDINALKTAQLNELITTDALKKFNDPQKLFPLTKLRWFPSVTGNIIAGDVTSLFNINFSTIFSIY
jgi:hypothetical protein